MRKYIEMLQRMIFWAWQMRWNWDFDALTMYRMQYLKLCRVHHVMKNNSHLLWNSSTDTNLMRKLTEVKGLAKKLSEDNYHKNAEYFFDNYKRLSPRGLLDQYLQRDGAKPLDEKVYQYFFRKAIERDAAEKAADKKRFYYLLDKYLEYWWD